MIITGEAPLSFDSISKLISDKDTSYLIEYNKSTLKGHALLVYLTNLDLDINIEFLGSKSDIFEIMNSYFKSDVACEIPVLDDLAAAILLEHKGLDHKYLLPPLPLTKDDILEFIKQDTDSIFKTSIFLDSMPLFMQTTVPQLNEMLKIEESLDRIDDKKYVTSNISTIISKQGFLDYYLSGSSSVRCFYFKRQFEDYMFKGKNLYDCLLKSESVTYGMFLGLLSEDIDIESLKLAREVADGLEEG